MPQKDNILQELDEIGSSLAGNIPHTIYTVPAGYFDGLAAQMLNLIKTMDSSTAEELSHLSPLLNKITKDLPYTVPQNYFEELAENTLASILVINQTAREELATLSPLLSGLKKEMPYSVPQGYFEQLSSIHNKEENKPATKVISLTGRKWFRYAAAAIVIGLIAITGLLLIGNGQKEPGGKALAKLTSDIKKMDEIQKNNLMDFIDAGMSGQETAQNNSSANSAEIKKLLQGVSEEELKDFEEQTEDIQDVMMTN